MLAAAVQVGREDVSEVPDEKGAFASECCAPAFASTWSKRLLRVREDWLRPNHLGHQETTFTRWSHTSDRYRRQRALVAPLPRYIISHDFTKCQQPRQPW